MKKQMEEIALAGFYLLSFPFQAANWMREGIKYQIKNAPKTWEKIKNNVKEGFGTKKLPYNLELVHKLGVDDYLGEIKYLPRNNLICLFESQKGSPLEKNWRWNEPSPLLDFLTLDFNASGIKISGKYKSLVELPFKRLAAIANSNCINIIFIKNKEMLVEQTITIEKSKYSNILGRLFTLTDGRLAFCSGQEITFLDYSISYEGKEIPREIKDGKKAALNESEVDPEKIEMHYKVLSKVVTNEAPEFDVLSVVDMADVGKLIVLTECNDLFIYDRNTLSLINNLKFNEFFQKDPNVEYKISSVKYIGNGLLVTTANDGWISIINSEDWTCFYPITNNRQIVSSLITPDGRLLTAEYEVDKGFAGENNESKITCMEYFFDKNGELKLKGYALHKESFHNWICGFDILPNGNIILCANCSKRLYVLKAK